jgi:hypothetical protein
MILAAGFLDPETKVEFLRVSVQPSLYKPFDLKNVL